MRDHINRMKILREQLGAMGDVIPDTSHAMRLLRHLPPSWDGVCQVLRASQPTVTKVKDRLLAEEQARKTQLAFTNAGNAQALTAVTDPAVALANLQALISSQFGSILLNPLSTTDRNAYNPTPKTRNLNPSQPTLKLRNPNLQCVNPNCMKKGHTMEKCWAKGGGMEGKGPRNKRRLDKGTRSNDPVTEVKLSDTDLTSEATAWVALQSNHSALHLAATDWTVDSGATTHISPFRDLFATYHQFQYPRDIGTADHGTFKAYGIGNIWISVKNKGEQLRILLTNVLYAPKCASNLASVNALTKNSFTVTFKDGTCNITDPSGHIKFYTE
jgi:gag-polypeptide of LTR copia-type